jgi:hypothetical protein
MGKLESNPATADEISRSFHAGGSDPFTADDRPSDEPPPGFAIRGAFTTEENMNPQITFPNWRTRLAVTGVAVAIAMVAAAAIANVPRTTPFEFGSAGLENSVVMDQNAHRTAYAAAANGSYVTGFEEFDNEVNVRDDGLGPLSETSNPEILD